MKDGVECGYLNLKEEFYVFFINLEHPLLKMGFSFFEIDEGFIDRRYQPFS